jgi:hypothetical protein
MIGFTALETAALMDICRLFPAESTTLLAQLDTASVSSRENTGHGFFTNFTVSRKTSALEGERLRSGGEALVQGIEYPLEFILWLSDGYANCLEGYSVGGDDTVGLDLASVSFENRPSDRWKQ